MISLVEKQEIILRHYHDGESQRKIHKDTGIDRKTIRKYIRKYEQAKREPLDNNSDCHTGLAQDIMENPQYDSSKRRKVKLTEELMAKIEFYVKENEIKRADGKAKQQKKKIDIYEELIFERWDEIFMDPVMTAAMIDRLTHKSYMINMNGNSYRLKETQDWLKNQM